MLLRGQSTPVNPVSGVRNASNQQQQQQQNGSGASLNASASSAFAGSSSGAATTDDLDDDESAAALQRSISAGSSDGTLMAGWLDKKGAKRWFILTATELRWCLNPKTDTIGQLPLARTRFDAGPKKAQFTIITPQKTYTFRFAYFTFYFDCSNKSQNDSHRYVLSAKTEELAQQWTHRLRKAIEAANAHQQQVNFELFVLVIY